jgi:hypothetical protein
VGYPHLVVSIKQCSPLVDISWRKDDNANRESLVGNPAEIIPLTNAIPKSILAVELTIFIGIVPH